MSTKELSWDEPKWTEVNFVWHQTVVSHGAIWPNWRDFYNSIVKSWRFFFCCSSYNIWMNELTFLMNVETSVFASQTNFSRFLLTHRIYYDELFIHNFNKTFCPHLHFACLLLLLLMSWKVALLFLHIV